MTALISNLKNLIGDMSNVQFARKVGLSEAVIRKILNGGAPNLVTLNKIARACGVSASSLIGDGLIDFSKEEVEATFEYTPDKPLFIHPDSIKKPETADEDNQNIEHKLVESAHQAKKSMHAFKPIPNEGSRIKVHTISPSAEWIILATMAVKRAEWLPDDLKSDTNNMINFTLHFYSFLSTLLVHDDSKWNWLMERDEALNNALKFFWDLRLMEDEISKKTSE